MISGDVLVFPNNAVKAIAEALVIIDDDTTILKRPLRGSDPNQSIGVFAVDWTPDDDSMEVRGALGASEPTLSRYLITVQAFVKDADEATGLARHTVMAKVIRSMLYRNTTLTLSLRSMSVELLGSTERTQRYGIQRQRFLSNEIDGRWLYLSSLDFWLETETI